MAAPDGPEVLLVEDDEPTRRMVTTNLGARGYRVTEAPDGESALRRWEQRRPDLVIVDLGLPGISGLAVIHRIRTDGATPILVLSARDQERDKVAALDAGADDYLTKPFGKAELLARISAIMRRVDRAGVSGGTSGPLEAGSLQLEPGRHEARVGETSLSLTPTEFRLLEALVRAAGDIVPHLQLARAGWPAETDPDLLWLKPHLARLRSKVEAAGGPAIVAVRGVGYRIVVEPEAAAPG